MRLPVQRFFQENMVQCDKEDAFMAKENAIKMMDNKEFVSARKFVLEAQRLYPELEGIPHLLTICDVHCAAEVRINNKEMDWYKIFQVEEAADKTIIRKQFLKLTRSLHPDRNKFPGAEAAFRLVLEAYSVLYDPTKRKNYDIETNRIALCTKCPHCQTQYRYYSSALNVRVRCQVCRRKFVASELKEHPTPTSSSVANHSRFPVYAYRTRKGRKCWTYSQQSHHMKPRSASQVADVEIQFPTLNQDKSSVPTEKENMHERLIPDPAHRNIVGTHNSVTVLSDAVNLPSSAKHSSACRKADEKPSTDQSVMLHEGVGIPMKNNIIGGRSSMPRPADPKVVNPIRNLRSEEDAEVALSAAAKTSKRKQDAGPNTSLNSDNNKRQRKNDLPSAHPAPPTHVSGETNIKDSSETTCTGDEVLSASAKTSKRNQDADPNTSLNSSLNSDSNKRQRKNDPPSAHVVDRQPSPPTHVSGEANIKDSSETIGTGDEDRDTYPEQDTTLQENTPGTDRFSDNCLSPYMCLYPDPEFHRFRDDRSCETFEPGQIWALYDDAHILPKDYGWITKVEAEPFAVHLIWLDACPQQEPEKRWLEQEISISTGTFRAQNQTAKFYTNGTFSHLVNARETGIPYQFEILPQVGEVWAVYMNWAPDWTPSSIDACEFAIGEVVSRNEASTRLSFLAKVDGYVAVFKPDEGKEDLEIPAAENSRFSHRVPCFRLTGEEGGELSGFYELDPASIPYVRTYGYLCCDDTP